MPRTDTTSEIATLHDQAYRELGPAGRFRIALELSDFTHALALAGVRRRNPQMTTEQSRRHLAEILYTTAE